MRELPNVSAGADSKISAGTPAMVSELGRGFRLCQDWPADAKSGVTVSVCGSRAYDCGQAHLPRGALHAVRMPAKVSLCGIARQGLWSVAADLRSGGYRSSKRRPWRGGACRTAIGFLWRAAVARQCMPRLGRADIGHKKPWSIADKANIAAQHRCALRSL